MRSYESTPELLDEYEMTCPYSKCLRTFYTNNSKAVLCCDSHRGKYYREINKERLNQQKEQNAGMLNNANVLKRLYESELKICSERELRIAGFNFRILGTPKRTTEGRVCYQFFEFILVKVAEEKDKYEVDVITKKASS